MAVALSGSLELSGSLIISGSIVSTGPITMSGSIASASYATSASNALSASNAVVAQTSSYANALTVAGTLTAQTLVVQTITSSVDFVTGSTRFGSLLANTHVFTGSLLLTGSAGINLSSSAYLTGSLTVQSMVSASTSGPVVAIRSSYVSKPIIAELAEYSSDGVLILRNALATTPTVFISSLSGGSSPSYFNNGSNVGIGITNPAASLHISSSTSSTGLIVSSGGNSNVPIVKFNSGLSSQIALLDDNANFIIGPSTFTSRVTTTTYGLVVSGSVGFGTSAPGYNLDIQGAEAKLQLKNNSTGGGTYVLASTYNAWSAGGGKFVITTDGGSAGIKFAIDGNNVGIGTYSPTARLEVKGSGDGDLFIARYSGGSAKLIYGYQASADGYLEVRTGADTTISKISGYTGTPSYFLSNVGIGSTNPASAKLYVYQDTAQGVTTPALKVSYIGAGNGNPQNVAMFTNDAVLASSGYIYIGSYSGSDWYIGKNVAGTSGNYNFQLGTATNNILGTLTTGGVWSTTGGGTSDRRTKKDISDITQEVLPFIKELKPVSFKFKEDAAQKTRRGFIAQDVLETSIPDLVLGDGDQENGIYGLDYDGILALAVKAIQELKSENDSLKLRIEALENK